MSTTPPPLQPPEQPSAPGAHPALVALSAVLEGALVLPGDPGWDDARAPWNLAVDQQPSAVVRPRSVRDLRQVIVAAREAGLGVTVQPRGHGAAADLAGQILVRTSGFDEVTVNVVARFARVGAGVPWGTLLDRLDGTGLSPWPAPTPTSVSRGTCSPAGIPGSAGGRAWPRTRFAPSS